MAVRLWAHMFHNKCVTIYNDNCGAASAIRTKAPKLYRMDLQYLIRNLATVATATKFYFWGLHITRAESPAMDLADGLSRFKKEDMYNIKKLNLIDDSVMATKICNELLMQLIDQPHNLPKNRDINPSIRKEYNILLDDDLIKNQKIKLFDNTLFQQHFYNILTK